MTEKMRDAADHAIEVIRSFGDNVVSVEVETIRHPSGRISFRVVVEADGGTCFVNRR